MYTSKRYQRFLPHAALAQPTRSPNTSSIPQPPSSSNTASMPFPCHSTPLHAAPARYNAAKCCPCTAAPDLIPPPRRCTPFSSRPGATASADAVMPFPSSCMLLPRRSYTAPAPSPTPTQHATSTEQLPPPSSPLQYRRNAGSGDDCRYWRGTRECRGKELEGKRGNWREKFKKEGGLDKDIHPQCCLATLAH